MSQIENKDDKCQQIERMIAAGKGVTESCREFGISEKTLYRWRKAAAN